MMTALLAELFGPEGQVHGIDFSGARLAQARRRLNGGDTLVENPLFSTSPSPADERAGATAGVCIADAAKKLSRS
jgi:hypothetical protein